MKKTERGVFCIESVGADESFKPTLKLLARQLDFSILGNAVRSVRTRKDLTNSIRDWGGRPDYKYPILWMWGHGGRDGFYAEDSAPGESRLDLGSLADIADDNWYGCLVHFGSCSTLAGNDACYSLLKASGLQGISGYSKDVDWIQSFAFEMLYMKFLQEVLIDREPYHSDGGISEESLAKCYERLFDSRMCSGLIDHLGFRMITRADVGLD